MRYWRDAADPDGPEQRHGRDTDLRRFRIGVGLDGVGHPDGYLTPVATAAVNGALARIERELFAADWAAAKAIHGDATTAAHLARTAAQRRHDALVEMATRALTAPADGKRPAPLVTVMVDFETFAGRVCELAAGTVIAPGAVAEMLGGDETLIQRVVADGANRVRDISSARQLPGDPAPRARGPAPALRPQDLLRPCRPMPGRPHPRLVRRRVDHPGQRPAGLRPPQPLVVRHRPIPPTTTRPDTRRPLDDDELDDEPDDHVGPRPRPRFMLRIALASAPDLQVGDGDERCTIDLHPLGRTTDRWRDYPIHTAA